MWKWKPDAEFQYGGRLGEFNGMSSQSHVSHCRVLPLGELIYCHDSRATCHIAGCKNSIRHIENRFSPYFITSHSLVRAKGEVFVLLYVCLFGQRFLDNPRADSRQSSHAGVLWFRMCFLPFWGLAAPGGRKKGK